ncbi:MULTISPECIES: hydantoinase B/oxoprolinase family protein [Desulfococcus]|uniref:Hydantoinase B/oxoprolinase n=1 Tax=Desulfococcus multivorans DSM 2059 TaxID=1121405 RepID=S7UYL5_DESML|nr:hydantoinase B/oxoprolinase family protein [Desulfococcus multivorans]AOY57497.1 uncharacterized protein Dmul_07220 [Desulfococcus multivorans]AQU99926.1 hypothetical protein B2D07_03465 [Desulfococcus multivorans]EPR39324.1 Hydantoinase B/oxoprolinase [Desulfococcus multivorans DSM 2059]SKA12740.1 Hydantoinase B/oxoprolinase [Desulfococcus multivorans DSM 2059]
MPTFRVEAEAALAAQGFSEDRIESSLFLNLRYQGTDTALMIPRPAGNIFANLFMSIAEQMGRMLQKTAISTNIEEGLVRF